MFDNPWQYSVNLATLPDNDKKKVSENGSYGYNYTDYRKDYLHRHKLDKTSNSVDEDALWIDTSKKGTAKSGHGNEKLVGGSNSKDNSGHPKTLLEALRGHHAALTELQDFRVHRDAAIQKQNKNKSENKTPYSRYKDKDSFAYKNGNGHREDFGYGDDARDDDTPVSYTHLTLPTIYSV